MLKSTDIVWLGPDINCLQLCTNDVVSEVVYKIAEQVCCIASDLDLSTLDYQCIIDKAKTYQKIDLFLLFSMLLENDCSIEQLIQDKIDELDKTELLVENLDLKCFLQDYLDEKCTIIRFYNQPGTIVDPNDPNTIFQKDLIAQQVTSTGAPIYYVSDIDQSVWEWKPVTNSYVKNLTANLNVNCYCELSELDLDVPKVLQVIINNICQTQSTGIIKACDQQYKPVHFDTVDPNFSTNFVGGLAQDSNNYYISKITHKIWRWVPSPNPLLSEYKPSLLSSSNINILDLGNCLTTHEQTFQNWVNAYQVYLEPEITSCLSTDPTILSLHLTSITDENICELKTNLGTPKDIYYSHLNSCSKVIYFSGVVNLSMNFNNVTQTDPNWATNLNNLNYLYVNKNYDYPFAWNGFQYIPFIVPLTYTDSKQDDELCNILGRLKIVETTCCTPTCDNTTIGFSSTYNEGVFTLDFNTSSGTNISEDFLDCGSIITVTDYKKNSVSNSIDLIQDLIYTIDVTSLDTSKPLIVNIKSCLSNGILTCSNCNTFSLPAVSVCGVCKICVEASGQVTNESNIKIVYSLADNPSNILTATLVAGQCMTFSLPEEKPTILSIIRNDDSLTLLNSDEYPCEEIDLTNVITDSCWFFELPVDLNKINSYVANPTANFVDLNFDSTYSKNPSYTYKTLETSFGNLPLSGFIFVGNATSLGNNAYLTPLAPITTFSEIKSSTICGQYEIGFNDSPSNAGKYYITEPIIFTVNNLGNRIGIVLKLQGQTITQTPLLEIYNNLSISSVWIKGELLSDDCLCPS
jgi:hypothetical protein